MKVLLEKYFTDTLSAEEKIRLFAAMEEDSALREEFAALQNTLALAECNASDHDEELAQAGYRHFTARLFRDRIRRRVKNCMKYAALIALVALTSYSLTRQELTRTLSEQYTEICAPNGQRVNVNLPDGTEVWLSPCSKLRYSSAFNDRNRDVQLEGATFFEVAHNARKPFRITTGKYRITVLGTRFNVKAYPRNGHFELDLVEGKVQVNNLEDESDQLILHPNERAVIRNNRLCKKISGFDNEEYLKSGIVTIDNRPLGEILEEVSLWHNVTLEIDDQVDTRLPVSGKIRQSDAPESILRALQNIAQFKYEIRDDRHIKIYN